MRFLVDSLPYYQEYCPLESVCCDACIGQCPRCWNKEFVCSDENPHYCRWLREEEANNE